MKLANDDSHNPALLTSTWLQAHTTQCFICKYLKQIWTLVKRGQVMYVFSFISTTSLPLRARCRSFCLLSRLSMGNKPDYGIQVYTGPHSALP